MIGHFFAAALLCVIATAGLAQPAARQVRLQRVIDGDSLVVAGANGAALELRLQGIDAPESCQAGGRESRQALDQKLRDAGLTLRTHGKDMHGRHLATLWADGDELTAWLVVEGHAWSARVKWDRGPYVKQERVAAALSRGVHAAGGAIQPSEFRRMHGPCGAGTEAPAAATLPRIAPPAARVPAPGPSGASPYRCDGRTHCSQMTSCAEATFFLRRCPGVKMDGNRDGVPCEKQWCR